MSVTQTDQLLQLVLNSGILVLACVLFLLAATLQHRGTIDRLRWQQVTQLDSNLASVELRRLRQRYRLTHLGVLSAHYALMFCLISTIVISVRSFVNWNGLIPIAIGLFVAGSGLLLLSVGVMLTDLARSRPLADFHLLLRPSIDAAAPSRRKLSPPLPKAVKSR